MMAAPGSLPPPNNEPSKPALRKSRILILCFDGTADQFDGQNSNVVKFYSMLRKDMESDQLCYYQTGIGTYVNPGIMTPMALWIAKTLDTAIAWYLDAHVMEGYKFIMQNYCVGDKICLFGFSRGAYTARALAGMLSKVGLLPKDNVEQIPFAYKMYTGTGKDALTQAVGFKQTFSRSVDIEFVGVWDTVASTGVIMSRTLPFTQSNTIIKTFRQALALDEHRAKFVPTFYHRPPPSPGANANDPERAGGMAVTDVATGSNSGKQEAGIPVAGEEQGKAHLLGKRKSKRSKRSWSFFSSSGSSGSNEQEQAEALFNGSDATRPPTDVKEVWFAGVHTDIGGGEVANNVASSLANIPLRWMVCEVVASQCGIQFDSDAMDRLNVHVESPNPSANLMGNFLNGTASGKADKSGQDGITSTDVQGNSTPSGATGDTTANPDAQDCMQPMHDQLAANPTWWLLEIIPLPFTWQDKNNVWQKKWKFHLGRGRYTPQNEPPLMFHETVKTRMGNASLKYTPRAKYQTGSEIYVS